MNPRNLTVKRQKKKKETHMRKLIVLKSWIYLIRNLSLYAFNDCIKWWMWMRMLTFDFLILVKFLLFSWLLKSEWEDSFWILRIIFVFFLGKIMDSIWFFLEKKSVLMSDCRWGKCFWAGREEMSWANVFWLKEKKGVGG